MTARNSAKKNKSDIVRKIFYFRSLAKKIKLASSFSVRTNKANSYIFNSFVSFN